MSENFTLVVVGFSILLVSFLIIYYLYRQIQNVKQQLQAVSKHVMFQQKIIEKQDNLISQHLQTQPIVEQVLSSTTPEQSLFHPSFSLPTQSVTSSTPPTVSNPVALNSSSIPLGPMVGSLLSMLNTVTPPVSSAQVEMVDNIGNLSDDEIDQELVEELEELKKDGPSTDSNSSKKETVNKIQPPEGRIDPVVPTEKTESS